jgi:hypothetical protein
MSRKRRTSTALKTAATSRRTQVPHLVPTCNATLSTIAYEAAIAVFSVSSEYTIAFGS